MIFIGRNPTKYTLNAYPYGHVLKNKIYISNILPSFNYPNIYFDYYVDTGQCPIPKGIRVPGSNEFSVEVKTTRLHLSGDIYRTQLSFCNVKLWLVKVGRVSENIGKTLTGKYTIFNWKFTFIHTLK